MRRLKINTFSAGSSALFLAALNVGWQCQAAPVLSPEDLFAKASPSVVTVFRASSSGAGALGSGVVVAKERVATNCHTLNGPGAISVGFGERRYQATVETSDWPRDVCLLLVPGLDGLIARLGTAKALRIGQRVYAIGTPKGLQLTLSDGLVSGFRAMKYGDVIQTTAPVSPGSSGGGLFDSSGALVGITTSQLVDGQNLNFAHPVDWIRDLLASAGMSSGAVVAAPADANAREKESSEQVATAQQAKLFFDDVAIGSGAAGPFITGTVHNYGDCTVSNLQIRASFKAGPSKEDAFVHSLPISLVEPIEPRGKATFQSMDAALAGHGEDDPSRGRWWVRMEVLEVGSIRCP